MSEIEDRATAEQLIPVLRWRAANQPDRLAYVFASEGAADIRLTYADLDRRARAVAVTLQSAASPGDCALLLFPPGLDFLAAFLGCLYARVVAVPLFAPRRNREDPRLNAIIEDSGARLALTVARALPERPSPGSRYGDLDFLLTDTIDDAVADRWIEPPNDKEELAYLQYTSGSTSVPKGVMVTHSNLLSNCAFMQEALELSEQTVSVTWLPHFHDMGLIDGLLNPLQVGYPAVIMAPAEFTARPIRWLQLISRFRATHSGAPNAAYDLCVRQIRPEQRAELDLSSWTVAYSAAEPVRAETLDRFAEFFAPCGFRRRSFMPAYGLAEATLMVSGTPKSMSPTVKDLDSAHLERGLIFPANVSKSRRLVGCGLVSKGIGVSIVDPKTSRICSEDTVGEIWVSGPTVAGGYWKRPDESSETFKAFIADTNDGPFLRTGDLGFLADNQLFVTGRLKDLIIISGSNYYPQDIEALVENAHPALRPGHGVAFSIEVEGQESLVIGHEIDRQFRNAETAELENVAGAIRRAVYESFDLDVYAVQLLKVGGIKKTSSGKFQRQACRADFLAGHTEALFESRLKRNLQHSAEEADGLSRSELLALSPGERAAALEERLRRRVARVLQMPWRQIDASEPLGSYGLGSLKGIQLIASIEDSLGVTLPTTEVFNYPNITALGRHLCALMGFAVDAGVVKNGEVIVQATHALEDERLAEFLGAVERISISDMQQMIADRQVGNKPE